MIMYAIEKAKGNEVELLFLSADKDTAYAEGERLSRQIPRKEGLLSLIYADYADGMRRGNCYHLLESWC